MPDRRDPPPTDEGWFALHDFRRIDWDAWEGAPDRERERALEEGRAHYESLAAVEDADDGATALYSVLGHKADLLALHLRPTTAHLDAIERRFETTDLARYTERATSYVSVTEASGYSERAREYFGGTLDDGEGLAKYIRSRLYPDVPDAEHVCFYPMDKRRDPEQNWYALPFEERAEHMDAHGEIGREYGGRVTQMITGSIGLDDWEWGITLWADDLADVKDLLYEMRFDPSTAQFAEFGSFYVGRRIEPADLPALLAGEAVGLEGQPATEMPPTDAGATANGGLADDAAPDDAAGGPPAPEMERPDVEAVDPADVAGRIATLGLADEFDLDAGGYAVICYSEADARALAEAAEDLRAQFDHYDTHRGTAVRAESGRSVVASLWETESAADTAAGFLTDLPGVEEGLKGPVDEGVEAAGAGPEEAAESIRAELRELDVYAGQPHGEDVFALVCYSEADQAGLEEEVAELREGFDRYDTHESTDVYVETDGETAAVVSLWATEDAAETASDYLSELPGIVGWAEDREGFGTMGMFYTVEPEHREAFLETFAEITDLLEGMEGHRETSLLASVADENDMFIASQWDAKEDALAFFRSDAFSETVEWGRDVLADRPRHVFLA